MLFHVHIRFVNKRAPSMFHLGSERGKRIALKEIESICFGNLADLLLKDLNNLFGVKADESSNWMYNFLRYISSL